MKYLQALLSGPVTKIHEGTPESPTKPTKPLTHEVLSVSSVSLPRSEKHTGAGNASEGPVHHVAEALPFLRLPLDVFARAGASLGVRVRWLDVTLWMVPTDRDAAQLVAEGVRRGRIWTASELMQVMAIADRTPGTVKTLAHAKLELDGQITEVRPRRETRAAYEPEDRA